MRIALLTSQWPGVRLGGIGVYTVACARGLALAGHEVHVFAPVIPKEARNSFPAGVFLHEVQILGDDELPKAMPVSGELMYRMALAGSLRTRIINMHSLRSCPTCEKVRFDIVEAPEYEGVGQGLVGSNFLGEHIPLVTQLHSGSAIAREAGNVANNPEQELGEAMELNAILGSDGVCAPSRAVIEDTRRAYGMADLAVDAEVIPLPVDMPLVDFALAREGAPVLYVGRLELLKGAHLLAQAAVGFLQNHPEATLRIVGPNTMTAPDENGKSSGRSMAQWMCAKLGDAFSKRVTFAGERTREEIEQEMKACAFVVCPSLRESYSYVCCEALAIGRPVVVSTGIGATDVVADAGLTFTRGEAGDLERVMGRLWKDRELRERLSRMAWERAATELSPEAAIEKRVAFYQRVIERWKKHGNAPAQRRIGALPHSHNARMYLLTQPMVQGNVWNKENHEKVVEFYVEEAALSGEIVTPGMRVAQQLESQEEGGRKREVFYLYGAGRHTAKLLMEKSRWEERGFKVAGLIDDHPRFATDPSCYGLPVISLATAQQQLQLTDTVILSTDAFEDQFWHQTEPLRTKGITVLRLYGHQSSEK